MWVYLLLLSVVFVLLIISIIYVVRFTHNIIKKHVNNKILAWLLSFIPILLFIIGLLINMINAIVIYIHLIVIVALIKLLCFIIKKTFKKEISEYYILALGVIITTIILTRAYYLAHHVYETNYIVYTDKKINVDNFRIVQISDSHIGATMNGNDFINYMEKINELKPDIVVVTGDFIDDNTSFDDLIDASNGLGRLNSKYGVFFIYGNHDKGYYNFDKGTKLKEELVKNNVSILEDASVNITDNIILIGRRDKSDKNRVNPIDMTAEIDNNKYIIMLDHQPNDYDNERKAGVDLVLSGHTHGGQLFPLGVFGVLLGANDMAYGMKTIDKTTFIVNSGIGDWAIKFKTGTKSEYVVVDIKNK